MVHSKGLLCLYIISCIKCFSPIASQESPEKCVSPLGPASKENPDSVFSASSIANNNHSPSRAKLGTTKVGSQAGAWAALYNNFGQWIQIDFTKVVKITRIASQGRDDANQWVTSYKIRFGLTRYFEDYNKGNTFQGNSDRKTIVGNVLEPPIVARYIRILPVTWYGHISMRLQFYGCTKGDVIFSFDMFYNVFIARLFKFAVKQILILNARTD